MGISMEFVLKPLLLCFAVAVLAVLIGVSTGF